MPFRLAGGGGDLAGAGLLANLMALPETLYNQRVEQAAVREMFREAGTPEERINIFAPGEDRPTPVGGTGLAGKILSGVGKTGAVMSAMLGAPIAPPRVTPTEEFGAFQRGQREQLAGMETDPRKKALIRLGQYDEAYGGAGGPKTPFQLAVQEATDAGMTQRSPEWYQFIRKRTLEMQGLGAAITSGARGDVQQRIKEWQDENKRRQLNGQPPLPLPSDLAGVDLSSGGDTGNVSGAPNLGPGGMSPQGFVRGMMKRGWTLNEAAGAAGNVHVESRFNPGIKSTAPGENSHGLMQWNGPRLRGLINYAAQSGGRDWHDPEVQMDYIDLERKGKSADYGGSNESVAYDKAFRGGGTAGDIAHRFNAFVERPLNPAATAATRRAMADKYAALGPGEEKLQPTMQLAQADTGQESRNVAFPSPAPSEEQNRAAGGSTVPGSAVGAGAGAQLPAPPQPRPTAAPMTPPQPEPGAPPQPPSPGGGIPGQQAGMPLGQVKVNIAGVDYTYDQLKHTPDWNDAATRLNIAPDTQDVGQANKVADMIRWEKMRGQKMDFFDLAAYSEGLPPRGPYTPEQSDRIMERLRRYHGDPSLRGQLARAKLADMALERLVQPTPVIDPYTAKQKVDQNGNPLYAQNPERPGTALRPVDALSRNPILARMPFLGTGMVEAQRLGMAGGPGAAEAASLLNQAIGEMATFVKAAGDSSNASEREQAVQILAYIPQAGVDTMESAVNKVVFGRRRLQEMQNVLKGDAIRYGETSAGNVAGTGGTPPPRLSDDPRWWQSQGLSGGPPGAPGAPAAPSPGGDLDKLMTQYGH